MGKSCVFHGIMEGFPWPPLITSGESHAAHCCALLRRCSALGLPKGSKGCKGFGLFGPSTPCKDRSHLTCLQDKKPQITESFTWFVHRIAVAFENNFFLALMSMGACAASVASASRIDGWKWGVFGWLWDGENAMRQQDRWSHHRDKCNSLITLLFFLMCLFHHLAADKCHEKWWHPHEAIGWVQTSMKRSWPPWPLWPLGSTMPGQRICGEDWNRAPGVKSRRGAGWPPGRSDSICRTSDYVYIFIYIYIKFITHIYIYMHMFWDVLC